MLCSGVAVVWAADQYRVNNNESVDIDEHGVSKTITNNFGYDIMVPTKTSDEWSAFRTNKPSGISLADIITFADCALPWDSGTTAHGGTVTAWNVGQCTTGGCLAQSCLSDTLTCDDGVWYTSGGVLNSTSFPTYTYQTCNTTCTDLGSCKVICTELKDQGLMSLITYKGDTAFADKYITLAAIKVYHWWGQPIAHWMAESPLLTNIMQPLGNAWAEHLAYAMGEREEDNKLGWILRHVFLPVHEFIGRIVYPDDQYTVDDLKEKTAASAAISEGGRV